MGPYLSQPITKKETYEGAGQYSNGALKWGSSAMQGTKRALRRIPCATPSPRERLPPPAILKKKSHRAPGDAQVLSLRKIKNENIKNQNINVDGNSESEIKAIPFRLILGGAHAPSSTQQHVLTLALTLISTLARSSPAGWRNTMEDAHLHYTNIDQSDVSIFGIFDGHGGKNHGLALSLIALLVTSALLAEPVPRNPDGAREPKRFRLSLNGADKKTA